MKVARSANQGFTLIELLLYVSIVGVLLTSISMFFATTADARIKNQSISEVNQQGTAIMELITQTIRNADAVTVPAVGATGASLTLTVPTASLSPTIFNLSGASPNAVQIKEGTGATVPLSNSKVTVSALSFKNLSRASTPGVVQVSFTISRVNLSGKNEYDYQKTFTGTATVPW